MKLGLKNGEARVVPYNEKWHEDFLKVKNEIVRETGIPKERIEHIGSTAIKGIVAKPILDIVVGVDEIDSVKEELFEGLKKIGFLRLRVERPKEIVLAKFVDDTYQEKNHFIHLVDYDKELWNNLIFFRDYLNFHEEIQKEYEKIKLSFFKEHIGGIEEYTNYKEKFVLEIYDKRLEKLPE